MHFDHSSAAKLKRWMVQRLEPICDADPAVLSDYVLALLRHNQPEHELKSSCLNQLQDFLSQETSPFVIDLFERLATDSGPDSTSKPDERSPSTPVSLGKRPLSGDLAYSPPPRASISGSLTDSSYAPRSAPLIPQYTPTQSHPSFLHFPQNQVQNFEISSTIAGLSSQLYDTSTQQSKNSKRPRRSEICRDYHFRGYCSRGDDCVYSHDESDSNIAKNLSYVPAYNPAQPNGDVNPISPPSQNSLLQSITPQLFNANFHGQVAPLPFSNEVLASILSANSLPPSTTSNPPINSNPAESSPRYNRQPLKKSQTTLVVENIPRASLSDRAVREYFSAFGPLASVSVEVHSCQALVEFESAEGAKRAYSSPEPVFNNRFVKIHFKRLNPNEVQSSEERSNGKAWGLPNGSTNRPPNIPALRSSLDPSPFGSTASKTLNLQPKPVQSTDSTRTLSEREKELRVKIDAQKRLLEQLSLKKTQNSSNGLSPSAKPDGGGDMPEKAEKQPDQTGESAAGQNGKHEIKESYEEIKKDTENPSITAAESPDSSLSKTPAGKAPQASSVINQFGRKVVALPRTPLVNTRTTWSPHATATKSFKLDNRTSTLAIRQIPSFSARDTVRDYLTQFGAIVSTAPLSEDDEVPDFSVKFATRTAAEKALNQGNEIPEVGKVSISWIQNNVVPNSSASTASTFSAIPGLKSSVFSSSSLLNSSSVSRKQVTQDEGQEENGEADGWKR